jgi:hypothetical protein
MFRPLSPGHHQVTRNNRNLRKLDTNSLSEFHRFKMQQDLIVVILYDSIYNQYKIVNFKYMRLIFMNYSI